MSLKRRRCYWYVSRHGTKFA